MQKDIPNVIDYMLIIGLKNVDVGKFLIQFHQYIQQTK